MRDETASDGLVKYETRLKEKYLPDATVISTVEPDGATMDGLVRETEEEAVEGAVGDPAEKLVEELVDELVETLGKELSGWPVARSAEEPVEGLAGEVVRILDPRNDVVGDCGSEVVPCPDTVVVRLDPGSDAVPEGGLPDVASPVMELLKVGLAEFGSDEFGFSGEVSPVEIVPEEGFPAVGLGAVGVPGVIPIEFGTPEIIYSEVRPAVVGLTSSVFPGAVVP